MSLRDMMDFTTFNCRNTTSIFDKHSSNILVDWKNLQIAKKGNNTKIIELNIEEVCRDKNEDTTIIFSIKQNYSNSKHVCNQIGGILFNPKSNADIKTLPLSLLKGNHLDEENITDLTLHCGNLFWIPIKLNETEQTTSGRYIWYQDIKSNFPQATFLPWLFGQPNGGR